MENHAESFPSHEALLFAWEEYYLTVFVSLYALFSVGIEESSKRVSVSMDGKKVVDADSLFLAYDGQEFLYERGLAHLNFQGVELLSSLVSKLDLNGVLYNRVDLEIMESREVFWKQVYWRAAYTSLVVKEVSCTPLDLSRIHIVEDFQSKTSIKA